MSLILQIQREVKQTEGTISDREITRTFESVPFKTGGGSIKAERSTEQNQQTKAYQANQHNYNNNQNEEEDDDDLLQACNFESQVTATSTNPVKNAPVMKRAPSSDVITVMQKQTTSRHSFGKKIKQQSIAIDSDEEDALLMQSNLIEKVESKCNFRQQPPTKAVLANKMNIKS